MVSLNIFGFDRGGEGLWMKLYVEVESSCGCFCLLQLSCSAFLVARIEEFPCIRDCLEAEWLQDVTVVSTLEEAVKECDGVLNYIFFV